jgi:Flp pilus assembly protein TadG
MIVDFGITYNHYISLTDAVRAGARVAAVSRSAVDPQSTTQTAVTTAANGLSLVAPADVSWTCPAGPPKSCAWTAGQSVTVSAKTPYRLAIFGLTVMSGNLTSTTTERIE